MIKFVLCMCVLLYCDHSIVENSQQVRKEKENRL